MLTPALRDAATRWIADDPDPTTRDELTARVGHTKGTRIVCRTGDPANLGDLRMASADAARSISASANVSPCSSSWMMYISKLTVRWAAAIAASQAG